MNKRCLLLGVLLLGTFTAFADKVLIVTDEWPQMEVFGAFLEREGGYQVEKVEQDKMPADLSGYQGVIEFVHGKLNDEPAAKMMAYAKNGGRLIVIHHGVSSGKKNTKGWYQFLGMELDRTEGAKHYYRWMQGLTLTLANVNPDHYITSNKVDYPKTIAYQSSDTPTTPVEAPAIAFENTEAFVNHQFTDGRVKTVLFGSHFVDPKSGEVFMQDRGGWYKPAGNGWVFYFQPGHAVSDFEIRGYCQILMNCLTWKQE